MATQVDVVVLTRENAPIDQRVLEALQHQQEVDLQIYQVIGAPEPSDSTRWSTIARARNRGRKLGESPWLMFVDDDVAIQHDCVRTLLGELKERRQYGALAADYLGERNTRGISRHVAMGATLFRREAIDNIQFRCLENRCECQCCCDDLRLSFWGIDYSPSANAVHFQDSRHEPTRCHGPNHASTESNAPGEILVAFDRNHLRAFKFQFLQTLRAHGNQNHVHAVVYDLTPRELRSLGSLSGVSVHRRSRRYGSVARDRLTDFSQVLTTIDPSTPIAYWDAGDVIFQTELAPLWNQIHQNQAQLIVSCEPMVTEQNSVYLEWIGGIHNTEARRKATRVVAGKPILNGGFVAGTAKQVSNYLGRVTELADSIGKGVADHGVDQTMMNLHLYGSDDSDFRVDDSWSYCLSARRNVAVRGNFYVNRFGNERIPVVHGNGGSLRHSKLQYAIYGSL